jgi:hypothetical protein
MKPWFLLLLVSFAVIAGFKFISYKQKLDNSAVEHERLSSVLARSRSTQNSELKVVRPKVNTQGTKESAKFVDAESELRSIFGASPQANQILLDSIVCSEALCEIDGVFVGTVEELTEVIKNLPASPTWDVGTLNSSINSTSEKSVRFSATFTPKLGVQPAPTSIGR